MASTSSSRRSFPEAAALAVALLLTTPVAGAAEPSPPQPVVPTLYERGVVDTDTTWSGEVLIAGQTVVKKGATLTVLPGTTVRFLWTDEDGDGIGDGELNVEGRIVARGEPGRPVTFTSARSEPAMKDWTFIMISTSRDSVLERCVVEYAFSGVQVHYSSTLIRNCLFRNNFEGVRFSTTSVDIVHNDFVDNYYALRYEANGSPAVIRRNTIRGNRYGVFPVQRSTSSVRIEENNISESSEFHVYFGENQRADLEYRGNWWGTTDPERIRDSFFDGTKDPVLGRVLWEPALSAPVEPCGIQ